MHELLIAAADKSVLQVISEMFHPQLSNSKHVWDLSDVPLATADSLNRRIHK